MIDLNSILTRCKGKWLMGGSVLGDLSNSPLTPYLIENGTDELSALALVSISLKCCYLPKSPEGLEAKDLIPKLDLPYVEGVPREHLKRALLFFKAEKLDNSSTLKLLASRGYAVNPLDWIPNKGALAAIPNLYSPWLAWLETGRQQKPVNELTADTWDDFYPSERLQILRELRAASPHEASSLIAQKAPAENAEKRLAIIRVLERGLGAYDIELLEQLEGDRSQKVRQLATNLLIRLGKKSNTKESIAELADFFTVKKSFLKSTVTLKKLKTAPQHRRREELMGQIPLTELLEELDLSSGDFIKRFRFDNRDDEGNLVIINLVAASIDDQEPIANFANKYLENGNVSVEGLERLTKNLPLETVIPIAERAIQKTNDENLLGITLAYSCLSDHPGTLSMDKIKTSKAYKRCLQRLKKQGDKGSYHIRDCVNILGFIADAKAAKVMVQDLVDHGMPAMDPSLALLRLNAALT